MTQHSLQRMAFLERFACLGADCEDTCCKSWNMQVDDDTVEKYRAQAPELLEAITEGPTSTIMRRDESTDYCVKYDNGWCGIHAAKGSDFLGDACHFYPRVTRGVGEQATMTAALSCPEVVRQALYKEGSFEWETVEIDRLPYTLKDYAPEGMAADAALKVHTAFLEHCASPTSPSRLISHIVSVSESMQNLPQASWPEAAAFYLKSADARLMAVEPKESDPFNLLHALMGIVKAAGAEGRPRLRETIADMESALEVELNWETLGIRAKGDVAASYAKMEATWKAEWEVPLAPQLSRWIAAQLSIAFFPFAGFGNNIRERAYLMGVRFATIRLALMSACKMHDGLIDEAQQVRIIQSIARVLDHLADPTLSLQIYEEPGWLREGRLRALVGDV